MTRAGTREFHGAFGGRSPPPGPTPGRATRLAAALRAAFAVGSAVVPVSAVALGCGAPDGGENGAATGEVRADTAGARGPGAAEDRGLPEGRWEPGPPLPMPVANNAVAALARDEGLHLFSFLGLDSTRTRAGILRDAYHLAPGANRWEPLPPVPGEEGRLAATAEAVGGRIHLFGGYTVAADGSEESRPNVDVWDPEAGEWSAAAPIPVPVDDAVSGVWRDSLIFLVSGWHDRDNVSDVQVYDPTADRWAAATPIPGAPVFGHAGGIVGDVIVYCDGVTVDRSRDPAFRITDACWRGDIDSTRPTRIAWSRLPPHPAEPRYRAAAGPWQDRGLLVFVGGTSNPYNYDGVGYDGVPSEPEAATFAYDVGAEVWMRGPEKPVRTMDHRGLVGGGPELWVVGGMASARRVTQRTSRWVGDRSSDGTVPEN